MVLCVPQVGPFGGICGIDSGRGSLAPYEGRSAYLVDRLFDPLDIASDLELPAPAPRVLRDYAGAKCVVSEHGLELGYRASAVFAQVVDLDHQDRAAGPEPVEDDGAVEGTVLVAEPVEEDAARRRLLGGPGPP